MYRQTQLVPTHSLAYSQFKRGLLVAALVVALAAVFVVRTLFVNSLALPRLFEIFEALTVLGSLTVILRGRNQLARTDWIVSLGSGAALGILVQFATLFNPYPVWDRFDSLVVHGIVRGLFVAIAALGGIVIMRWGGPVRFRLARREWRRGLWGLGLGLIVGIPFAVLNLFANSLTQGRPFVWQSPFAAGVDALQPAVFEEMVYRFALLGLFWLVLRGAFPRHAPWLAGLLAMAVHSYSHYSELFVQAPLVALGMGAALALLWGLPLTFLALRRDLEAAVGFHWIQDALRFWGGL